jgi:hypothetical protein
LPPSLERLTCASWLIYATKGESEDARRIKALILAIKKDRIDGGTGQPIVRLVVERACERLGSAARTPFGGDPVMVPVPGSALQKPHTVFPALRVCEELVRNGLGHDVAPVLTRSTAVRKSAGSSERPSLMEHLSSFTLQKTFVAPSRLVVVDDVVTSGTTMMACALKLADAFPGVPIGGFALARVQSEGSPDTVLSPLVEVIVPAGRRCSRRAV